MTVFFLRVCLFVYRFSAEMLKQSEGKSSAEIKYEQRQREL